MLGVDLTDSDLYRPVGSWLRVKMPTATAGYLNQLLRKGHLTINGQIASEMQALLPGDTITLKESGRARALLNARIQAPAVEILFQDDRIVCINKPGDLSMHAAEGAGETLTDRAASYLHARERTAHPHAAEPTFKLRPVNRLDRGTSGAVLLAKSSTAAGIFGRMVMDDGLEKLYLAIVSGRIEGSGEIDVPVEDKEALTRYRALAATRDA